MFIDRRTGSACIRHATAQGTCLSAPAPSGHHYVLALARYGVAGVSLRGAVSGFDRQGIHPRWWLS